MKYLLLFLLFLSLEAFPCQKEVKEILEAMTSFQADFIEENYQEEKIIKKEGRIFIKKPGLLRLDYFQPEKVSLYVKGKIVTHYDYNLEEVSYLSDKEAYLDFLSKREVNFEKDFEKVLCQKEGDNIKLFLQKQEMTVELFFKNHELTSILLYSEKNLVNKVIFLKKEINLQLKVDIFTFKDKKFLENE